MIDLMIPLGGGSHIDDFELRFALRSICKHIKAYRNLYIIGKCPTWLKGAIHIPMDDEHLCKETNIYLKVLAACRIPEISDDFLFLNDDHFILQDFVAKDFPFYYKGTLLHALNRLPPYSKYSTCVHNTAMALRARGFREHNFDTHTPIIYNKHRFAEIMPTYDWTGRFSYVVKSLYANSLGLDGIKEGDCKWNDKPSVEEFKRRIDNRPCFSIGNGAIGEVLHLMWNELYPMPSQWES